MSPFKEKYLSNWRNTEDSIPYPFIKRRWAEIILMDNSVKIKRHREVREMTFPFKFKKAVYSLLP